MQTPARAIAATDPDLRCEDESRGWARRIDSSPSLVLAAGLFPALGAGVVTGSFAAALLAAGGTLLAWKGARFAADAERRRRDRRLAGAVDHLTRGTWIGLPDDDELSRAIEDVVRTVANREQDASRSREAELASSLESIRAEVEAARIRIDELTERGAELERGVASIQGRNLELVRELESEKRRLEGWEDLRRRLDERADNLAADLRGALERARAAERRLEDERSDRRKREHSLESALEERNEKLRALEGDVLRERGEAEEARAALAREVERRAEEVQHSLENCRRAREDLEDAEEALRSREKEWEDERRTHEQRTADHLRQALDSARERDELARELESVRGELRESERAREEERARVSDAESRSTEIARRTTELEEEVARLARENSAREDETLRFFDEASSTLRTPIRLAARRIELLGDGPTPSAETNASAAIEVLSHLARAERTIDLAVELCRLGSPRQKAVWTRVDPRRLVARTVADVREVAEERRLVLEDDLPIDLPEIITDERLFTRVVRELLTNATEFTPAGGRVDVRLRAKPLEPRAHAGSGDTFDTVELHVTIADTGPGIAPADHERIFQAFERADARPCFRSSERGAGLGLAVAAAAAKRLGGRIEVESAVGSGSRFSLVLTARLANAPAPLASSSVKLSQ